MFSGLWGSTRCASQAGGTNIEYGWERLLVGKSTTQSIKRLFVLVSIVLVTLGHVAAASEKLLVSSFPNHRVERYSVATGNPVDFIDGGGALLNPLGAAIGPDGNLYVTSEGNNRILCVDSDTGQLISVVVQDDPGTLEVDESGGLDQPTGVLFGGDGLMYVASFNSDSILRYDELTGEFVDVFVPSGSGGLDGPDAGMVFGPGGDLFVPSYFSHRVLRYSGADGSSLGAFIPTGVGGLNNPRNLLFRPSDGNLLVTSEGSDEVLLYDGTTGAPMGAFVSSVGGPSGLAFGSDGALYVASTSNNRVSRYDGTSGTFLGNFVTGVSTPVFIMFVEDGSPDFTEQEQFGDGRTLSVAWADVNNDGELDLALANETANHLYIGGAGTSFVGGNEFGSAATFAIAFADFDNDGDPDAAVGNSPTNRLFVNDGSGTFAGQPEFGAFATIAMAWGDADNDGDLDLAVGNGILDSGLQQNFLYINNGGTFEQREEFGTWRTDSLAWGDFDNDGDLDLAVGNGGFSGPGEPNFLYINDGNLGFEAVAQFGEQDTTAVAWADANNDGFLDLAVANWGNDAQSYLYINNAGQGFTAQPAFGALDTNTIAWADYDNDGDLDLAVGNGDFGSADQNHLYVNQGDATFVEFEAFGLGSTDSLAWADVDGDGDLDIAAGNEHTPSTNYLYVNNENDSDYLILHLIGHRHDLGTGYSNRDGIGARVSVFEPGHICDPDFLLGMRQVEALGGFSPQNSIDLEFGVPGQATVDVRIDWPGSDGSSIVQELFGVAVAQRLVVDEAVSVPTVDCNGNSLSDACEMASGASPDCNDTGIPDECDISGGGSVDCTSNGVPDECEPDCNNTGTADSCDILNEVSEDCSGNGVPDECEPDCNNTGAADSCDILNEVSEDCSGNDIPDECEPDCNDTGTADSCDILDETSFDCNENGVPDSCDLADETSPDVNSNGIPDECESCFPPEAPQPSMLPNGSGQLVASARNRFLSFSLVDGGVSQAVRVVFEDLPAPFDLWNGATLWVGPTSVVSQSGTSIPPVAGFGTFTAATLVCGDPVYQDWSALGTVHVFHEGIVPVGTYRVQVLDESCLPNDEDSYSEALIATTTTKWGDTVLNLADVPPGPAEGAVNVTDALAVLGAFSSVSGAIVKPRADLEPGCLDLKINVSDVLSSLAGFVGLNYPFAPTAGDACSSTCPNILP